MPINSKQVEDILTQLARGVAHSHALGLSYGSGSHNMANYQGGNIVGYNASPMSGATGFIPQQYLQYDNRTNVNRTYWNSYIPVGSGGPAWQPSTTPTIWDNLEQIRQRINNIEQEKYVGYQPLGMTNVFSSSTNTISITEPSGGSLVFNLNTAQAVSFSASITFAGGSVFNSAVTGSGSLSLPNISTSGSLSALSFMATSGDLYLGDTQTGFESATTRIVGVKRYNQLRSYRYEAGLSGFNIDGDSGNAEFNNINLRGSLIASSITYNQIQATAGSILVAKSAGKLKTGVMVQDSTAGSPMGMLLVLTYSATQPTNLDIEDPPGVSHATAGGLWAANDYVLLQDGVNKSWLQISSVSDQTTFWRLVCTKKSGSNYTFVAGTAVTNFGQSGQGYLYMTADNVDAPFYSVRNWTGNPYTSGSTVEVGRFGMMRNAFGVTGAYHGFGVGDYAGGNYLKYDTNGGFALKAGGGSVSIDSGGIVVVAPAAYASQASFRFSTSGLTVLSGLYVLEKATSNDISLYNYLGIGNTRDATIRLQTQVNTGQTGQVELQAVSNAQQPIFRLVANDSTGSYIKAEMTGGSQAFLIDYNGNTVIGNAAIGRASTNGFFYIPTTAGSPTGIPTTYAGRFPLVVDSSGNAVYYYNSSWQQIGASAGNADIGARVYHSTTQATSNNVWFAVAFDSERWDTDTIHDTVTNNGRLTCKTAGKYLITGHAEFDSTVSPIRMRFKLNASTAYIAYTDIGTGKVVSLATVYNLAVNDYVTMEVYQNTGGGINLTGTGNYGTEFAMQKIA